MLAYTPSNPYQDLLRTHLEALGATVTLSSRLFFLPQILSVGKPKVVHLHWLEPYYKKRLPIRGAVTLGLFALQLAFLVLSRIPIVWTVHNLGNHEKQNLRLERYAYTLVYRAAKHVIVHCRNAGTQLQDRFPAAAANPGKITVIPIGNYGDAYPNTISREDARSRLGLDADDFVFLSLGAIREYKGGTDLIDAFRSLESNVDSKLIIVGKAHREEARAHIENSAKGLGDRFLFHPVYVADDDVQVYLNASDAFVAPFRDVLTSSSVVLALAFGKPVIAPRLGCLSDTLRDASEFLYDPTEESALQRAMRAAIDMRPEMSTLSLKCRQIANRMSWSRIAELTKQCYFASE